MTLQAASHSTKALRMLPNAAKTETMATWWTVSKLRQWGNHSKGLWFLKPGSANFLVPRSTAAPHGNRVTRRRRRRRTYMMRRFLLVAAAGAIALLGLSANQCSGEQKPAEQTQPAPEAPPMEQAPAPEAPAESPPAETPPQ